MKWVDRLNFLSRNFFISIDFICTIQSCLDKNDNEIKTVNDSSGEMHKVNFNGKWVTCKTIYSYIYNSHSVKNRQMFVISYTQKNAFMCVNASTKYLMCVTSSLTRHFL